MKRKDWQLNAQVTGAPNVLSIVTQDVVMPSLNVATRILRGVPRTLLE